MMVSGIEIRFAHDHAEVDAAMALQARLFPSVQGGLLAREQKRKSIIPEYYEPRNWILGIRNGKVVAAFRFYERTLKLGAAVLPVLGLTDYCVDSASIEEPIFGVRFLAECCNRLRTLDYAFALGSARRAMADYYYKFGFISCHAYGTAALEKPPAYLSLAEDTSISSGANAEASDRYEALRRTVFEREWGYIWRSERDWEWIFEQVRSGSLSFHEVLRRDKVIGYYVARFAEVIDFGAADGALKEIVSAVILGISRNNPGEEIKFNFSARNPAFGALRKTHWRFTQRYVPNEGIIALPLGDRALLSALDAVSGSRDLSKKLLDDLGIDESKLSASDKRLLTNALFLGSRHPFFAGESESNALPQTDFRFNDLDTL